MRLSLDFGFTVRFVNLYKILLARAKRFFYQDLCGSLPQTGSGCLIGCYCNATYIRLTSFAVIVNVIATSMSALFRTPTGSCQQ